MECIYMVLSSYAKGKDRVIRLREVVVITLLL